MIDKIKFEGKDIYINDMKLDTSETLSFIEFEAIYATIKSMIRITSELFEISEKMDKIPKGLYSEIIRLHNAAVDYIEAYNDLIDKEEK